MRQRIGLAQCLIADPSIILLDEPSNGLDPIGQEEICHLVRQLHAAGKTIVLATHQLEEVVQTCTHIVILKQGAIHYENSTADALSERPHSIIYLDRPVSEIAGLLESMHPSIKVDGQRIELAREATVLRRQILSIVLSAGYDVLRIEHGRASLAEIYAEAVS